MLYLFTLNWNGADKLLKLKESIMPNLEELDYTWLIKDNASKDDSAQLIKSWENNNIKCIEYKNNQQNFSAGMNFLFAEASPVDNDLILLLTSYGELNQSSLNITCKSASRLISLPSI